jgi:outer membrane protein assembly factor BamB
MKKFLFTTFLFVTALFACTSPSDTLKFAQLTDIHVSPGTQSEKNLEKVVEDINAANVDFAVVTGDLTNTGSNAELLAAKKILDKLNMPYYAIPGNHETNWSESACMEFNQLWGNDRFLFSKGNYLFIGFNTGPYMKMGDGHVKQEDLRWLQRILKERDQDQTLISFAHYPLADGLDNWSEVTGILKGSGCKLAFCGHGHRLKLLNFDGIPGIMGRSLVMKGTDKPGFTLVKLRNDSAFIFNKESGKELDEFRFAFDLFNPDTLSQIPVSPFPDFSVNAEYPGIKVDFEYKDTASIFTGPCLINDSLLVYGNSLGFLKAIGIPDGVIRWSNHYQGSLYSTPVSNGQVVAFGTADGHILGVNAEDGKEIWRIQAETPVLAEGITEGDDLYIGAGQSAFYKINMITGHICWTFDGIEGLVQGKSALGDDEVVFGAWDEHLYCLDKTTGKLNWKWDNGTSVKLYSPGNITPVISDDKIFLVAPDRYMTALDRKSGCEVWRTNMHQVRESIGISPDGKSIYAKLMNDSIIAMSATAEFSKTEWAIDAGIGYDHNPCPVVATENVVIGATKNGLLSAVDIHGKKVLWKFKAGNSSVNKIVTSDSGDVWVSLIEGNILRLNIEYN